MEYTDYVPFVGAVRTTRTDWPIVSMVVFQERLFVATTNGIYEKINNEFVPLKFVVMPEDAPCK